MHDDVGLRYLYDLVKETEQARYKRTRGVSYTVPVPDGSGFRLQDVTTAIIVALSPGKASPPPLMTPAVVTTALPYPKVAGRRRLLALGVVSEENPNLYRRIPQSPNTGPNQSRTIQTAMMGIATAAISESRSLTQIVASMLAVRKTHPRPISKHLAAVHRIRSVFSANRSSRRGASA